MRKKLFAIIFCIPFLTGCWDQKELNDIAMTLAMSLDKDADTEELIATYQVVRPEALREQSSAGRLSPVEIFSVRGKTLFDIRKNISKKFDRLPYFSHNRIVIISERLAKDGLQQVLDRLIRSNEMRPLAWIIIAKGAPPEELLSVEHGVADIQAVYLDDIINSRENHSEASVTYLQQFVENLLGGVTNPTAGVMEITGGKTSSGNEVSMTKEIKLTGMAVFKKDKLAGYLDDKETKGVNWITGKIKSGAMLVSSPTQDDKYITTNIKKVKSSIKPEKKGDEFIFNIKISETSELMEQQDLSDTSEPNTIVEIEKLQQETIKKEVKTTMDKLQNELQVDILGFGSALSKEYPKEWKKIKKDWPDMFPKAKYTVTVESRIARTGLLLKPIKTEE